MLSAHTAAIRTTISMILQRFLGLIIRIRNFIAGAVAKSSGFTLVSGWIGRLARPKKNMTCSEGSDMLKQFLEADHGNAFMALLMVVAVLIF